MLSESACGSGIEGYAFIIFLHFIGNITVRLLIEFCYITKADACHMQSVFYIVYIVYKKNKYVSELKNNVFKEF